MPADLALKPGYANGALRFVNGASRRTRSAVLVAVGCLVVALAGPFGTGSVPFWPRAGFWLAVGLFNFAKWELWFALLRRRGWPWRRIIAVGLPLLLLPLPLEVDLGLRLFAGHTADGFAGIWLRGAAIGVLWSMVLLLFLPHRKAFAPRAAARFPGTAIRPAEIAAMTAEDHYVRLHLADGRSRLLHMRFADAVAAMADRPGERVHRGAWVAERHRGPAEYRNRRWFVLAAGGVSLPVSRSRAAGLREKGWLTREG